MSDQDELSKEFMLTERNTENGLKDSYNLDHDITGILIISH
jgi:hypothetical protein